MSDNRSNLDSVKDRDLTNVAPTSDSSPSPRQTLALPKNTADSRYVLEYIGFTTVRALGLWNAWTMRETGQHGTQRDCVTQPHAGTADVTFIAWVLQHLGEFSGHDDGVPVESRWRRYMSDNGLRPEFHGCVWESYDVRLRTAGGCTYWVRETIRGRYEGLKKRTDETQ
ncbi:hypothetical protein Micbo1qcDRAFT_174832 [Microdochium bolleyi]|uniref:Uncharacterized protein n=1 Tax=Microdochium bolleyi TaxID=196109 RepID=A0A136J3Q4_9PEZI|nr:hypothetical protein Micbo1qcDRAFT_174832 [Microdochium bolleyi]